MEPAPFPLRPGAVLHLQALQGSLTPGYYVVLTVCGDRVQLTTLRDTYDERGCLSEQLYLLSIEDLTVFEWTRYRVMLTY